MFDSIKGFIKRISLEDIQGVLILIGIVALILSIQISNTNPNKRRWEFVTECATHRPLKECKLDALELYPLDDK